MPPYHTRKRKRDLQEAKDKEIANKREAIQPFDKKIEIDPLSFDAYIQKGNILKKKFLDMEEAIRCYDKVIELNPHHREALVEKGDAFKRLNRIEEAIECYDNLIELDPLNPDGYYKKGLAYNESSIRINEWFKKGGELSTMNKVSILFTVIT